MKAIPVVAFISLYNVFHGTQIEALSVLILIQSQIDTRS